MAGTRGYQWDESTVGCWDAQSVAPRDESLALMSADRTEQHWAGRWDHLMAETTAAMTALMLAAMLAALKGRHLAEQWAGKRAATLVRM